MTDSTASQIDWLQAQCTIRERSINPIAKISGLAYLIVQRPDPETAARFFVDYGLIIDRRIDQRIYLRGSSTDSHLIIIEKGPADITTVGFFASSDDVEKLAEHFNTPATSRDAPIGGRFVTLKDPDGLTLEINSDLNPLDPLVAPSYLDKYNTADKKNRVNQPVRNVIEPRTVARLGHTLWSAKSMKKTIHWYQDVLGLLVSDFQFVPNDATPIVAFMRCDQGNKPSDHHTLGIGSAIELGHVHSAFEMDSFEDVAINNKWMIRHKSQFNYTHGWGIGRHILGSQIFDYWRDPYGDLFEHYADGDLFDSSIPTGYHLFHSEAQHQWGPDMTAEFKGMTQPLKMLKFLIKRLPQKDDLTAGRLIRMVKAI